jgi:hypothetical protein
MFMGKFDWEGLPQLEEVEIEGKTGKQKWLKPEPTRKHRNPN